MKALNGTNCRECPTRSTRSLIFGRGNGVFLTPVNGFGQQICGKFHGFSFRHFLIAGEVIQELFLGEVHKLVLSKLVGVGLRIMGVNEFYIVLVDVKAVFIVGTPILFVVFEFP